MKYLFFDIECCDGIHMCEFGYVLIDEQFNILERDCLTINPEYPFKLAGREHEKDIRLAFSEDVYYLSPKFDYYYNRIKSLLTMQNCKIIGFSIYNDIKFLSTVYKLYNKEPISFTYYDFQKFYQGYTKVKNRKSLESVVEELNIDNIQLHKSDDDSYAVIRALRIISKKEGLTLSQTLEMLKKEYKNYMAEKARGYKLSIIEKVNNKNPKAQKEFLKNFIHRLKINKDYKESIFFNKTICISSHFQENRFNEFLSIIERLYAYGATYTGKASTCDIFLEYQDGEEEDVRIISVRRAIEMEEKEIKILSLDELLKLLNLTEEELNKVDHINCKLYAKTKDIKNKNGKIYIDKNNKSKTIGDVLRLQGIDMSKFAK